MSERIKWEDPGSDMVAAIRQIQEILETWLFSAPAIPGKVAWTPEDGTMQRCMFDDAPKDATMGLACPCPKCSPRC